MGPAYKLDNFRYGTDSIKGQLTVESQFGLLQATVYTNWLRVIDTPGFANETLRFKNRVTVAEVHDIFKVGAHHTLRAAMEYRHNTEGTTPTTGASVHYDVLAASGMWNWKITPALSLTNALRMDHLSLGRDGYLPPGYPFSNSDWNRTFTQLSFNSGLVWKTSETDSVRFMVSRGTELPNLSISGGFLVLSPFIKDTGTPFLEPSVVNNYEIGWDHVLPGPNILFRASVFDQDSFKLLAVGGGFIPTPGGPYFTPSNVGSSEATGLELELKGTLSKNYRWGVNYRPEWISDNFVPSAQNGAAYVDYQHTTPLHLVKANLGWASGRWEMDGYLHYQSSAHGLQPTPTSAALTPVAGFVSMDGRVAYNLTDRVTWAISGQNLTHASQVQTSGPAVERRVLGTISIAF
jgi:iron complex outermembrane receptor protein